MTDTEIVSTDTKHKILEASRSLFAKNGYEGTSIREIAKHCDVNIAAVNYHFKNKENLFWEIILHSYEMTEKAVAEFNKDSSSVLELSMKIFDHFYSQSDVVKTTMKMVMAENMQPPQDSEVAEKLNASFGPPGGRFIAEQIQKEIPYKFSEEDMFWGVKAIFGCIIHWSMMCNMARMKPQHHLKHLLEPKQIRKDVENIVRSTVEYIKNHPEIFNKG